MKASLPVAATSRDRQRGRPPDRQTHKRTHLYDAATSICRRRRFPDFGSCSTRVRHASEQLFFKQLLFDARTQRPSGNSLLRSLPAPSRPDRKESHRLAGPNHLFRTSISSGGSVGVILKCRLLGLAVCALNRSTLIGPRDQPGTPSNRAYRAGCRRAKVGRIQPGRPVES